MMLLVALDYILANPTRHFDVDTDVTDRLLHRGMCTCMGLNHLKAQEEGMLTQQSSNVLLISLVLSPADNTFAVLTDSCCEALVQGSPALLKN